MSWGHKPLTPQRVLASLPEAAHSLVVQLGQSQATSTYFWQLRRHHQIQDVAFSVLTLPKRQAPLELAAETVAAFQADLAGLDLLPMYLLQVRRCDINRAVWRRLNQGAPAQHHRRVFIVVAAATMYDFLANATAEQGVQPLTVGALLDGWPMASAWSLAAFLTNTQPAQRLMPTPLPATTAVAVPHLQQADMDVVALFDAPLRAMAARADSTFVFTDVE